MIHDAFVEVTCDNVKNCDSNAFFHLNWYVGGYDKRDSEIESELAEMGWIVDGGNHYCCEECANAQP